MNLVDQFKRKFKVSDKTNLMVTYVSGNVMLEVSSFSNNLSITICQYIILDIYMGSVEEGDLSYIDTAAR